MSFIWPSNSCNLFLCCLLSLTWLVSYLAQWRAKITSPFSFCNISTSFYEFLILILDSDPWSPMPCVALISNLENCVCLRAWWVVYTSELHLSPWSASACWGEFETSTIASMNATIPDPSSWRWEIHCCKFLVFQHLHQDLQIHFTCCMLLKRINFTGLFLFFYPVQSWSSSLE